MKKLAFRLDLQSGAIPVTDGEIDLALSMPGMTMAPNIVALAPRGGGRYEGQGVIVNCTSGSRVWQSAARIRLAPQARQPHRVRFAFKVK